MRHGLFPVKSPHGPILAQKLYNPGHFGDDFLSVVLVHRGENDFVVWVHNAQTNGFSCGDYYTDETKAWDCFNNRGVR